MIKKPEYIVIGQFIVIIVLVILLVRSCKDVRPIVTPAKTIIAEVEKNEDASAVVIDSLSKVIEKKDIAYEEVKDDLDAATELVTGLLNEPPAIVTKTKVDSVNLVQYLERVKTENRIKDSLSFIAINNRESVIQNQKYQLSEKDSLYSKNRALTDSLASNQVKVEGVNLRLTKKLNGAKTANKILIGVTATLAAVVTVQNIK